jgi:hypothetical protein
MKHPHINIHPETVEYFQVGLFTVSASSFYILMTILLIVGFYWFTARRTRDEKETSKEQAVL